MNYVHNAMNPFLQQDQFQSSKQSANPLLNSFDQPQTISPMDGAASELQMSLDVLSKVIEELRMRVAPVLRGSGSENGNKDASAPRDVASPLREVLDGCTKRVGGIRNSLQDILSRLEV